MRQIIVAVLGVICGLSAGQMLAPSSALAGVDVTVDDGGINCLLGGANQSDWLTIKDALDHATTGQTIFVCDGDYLEPTLQVTTPLTLLGPGSTQANDGSARVKSTFAGGIGSIFYVITASVTIQGFELDAVAPVGYTGTRFGILANPTSSSIFADNTVLNAPDGGIAVISSSTVQVLRNVTTNASISCSCTSSMEEDNLVTATAPETSRLEAIGFGNSIRRNHLTRAFINAPSNSSSIIDGNMVDGGGIEDNLLYTFGDPVTVSNNVLSNGGAYGMFIGYFATSATVIKNTIQSTLQGIHIFDFNGADAQVVHVTIGGNQGDGNTFIDSGGTPGDANYLLLLEREPLDVDAEYNNWGLCTAAEIEQEVFHDPDDSSLGVADYEPFIPANCPTPAPTPTQSTPTATPVHTATHPPTPGPTVTPAPTQGPVITQGNVDCDEVVGPLDALLLYAYNAGLRLPQTEPCPDIADDVHGAGLNGHPWGDVNCDDFVNTVDGIALLRHLAGFPYEQTEPCVDVGQAAGFAGAHGQ